jgi:hypothetical protein
MLAKKARTEAREVSIRHVFVFETLNTRYGNNEEDVVTVELIRIVLSFHVSLSIDSYDYRSTLVGRETERDGECWIVSVQRKSKVADNMLLIVIDKSSLCLSDLSSKRCGSHCSRGVDISEYILIAALAVKNCKLATVNKGR